MAEVAIPVVALGAMWLINNDNKKEKTHTQEGFDNVSARNQRSLHPGHVKSHLPIKPPVNFPKGLVYSLPLTLPPGPLSFTSNSPPTFLLYSYCLMVFV